MHRAFRLIALLMGRNVDQAADALGKLAFCLAQDSPVEALATADRVKEHSRREGLIDASLATVSSLIILGKEDEAYAAAQRARL
jgi:hypothetical protein